MSSMVWVRVEQKAPRFCEAGPEIGDLQVGRGRRAGSCATAVHNTREGAHRFRRPSSLACFAALLGTSRFVGTIALRTLFRECLDDWIDEDNPVRVVDAFVEAVDLGELGFDGVAPEATGRPFYHPSVLLKLGRKPLQYYAGENVRCVISIAQSSRSGVGPPKSRLLGAHCGRSWPARPFSKADTMSAKRFRQLWVGKQTFKTVKALADHDPERTSVAPEALARVSQVQRRSGDWLPRKSGGHGCRQKVARTGCPGPIRCGGRRRNRPHRHGPLR